MNVRSKIPVLKSQEAFANSMEKFSCILGGFGSGKSRGDVFRSLVLLKKRNPATIVIVAPTYGILEDVNIPDFREIFDQFNIRYHYNKTRNKMAVNQGSFTGEVWFRSADKPERIVGFDATDFIIDEYDILKPPKQRELWRKIIARIRGCKDATGAVSTTPEGFRETYSLFEKKKIGPLFRAKTTDNILLPNLDEYLKTLYSQYDKLLVKQYIDAQFVNINGMQAYYGFDRNKNHLSNNEFFKKHEYDFKHAGGFCVGIDFNVGKMCAELFIHLESKKRIHFFDEVVLRNPGFSEVPQTQKMVDILKERYPNKDMWFYPDATGKRGQTSATESDIAIIRKNNFRVYARAANPFVRDRLNAANLKLGNVSVTVDTDKCTDLTEDFERCERDLYGDLDKKDEERTHSSDAGTYPIAYLYPIKRRKASTVYS
jgi:hypothetical protein